MSGYLPASLYIYNSSAFWYAKHSSGMNALIFQCQWPYVRSTGDFLLLMAFESFGGGFLKIPKSSQPTYIHT